jgi:UDP-N-acetylmuramate dehydrogenase
MADIGILENVPLAGYSTFRCGGPARYFAEPATGDEVERLFRLAGEQNWDVFILGNGSNCLISDEGFDGLVIRIGKNMSELKSEELEDGRVKITAGAGLSYARFGNYCTELSLTGAEFACGIPGSCGGAVFMNAGAYGGEMKDVVVSVRLMKPDGSEIYEADAAELEFGYRHSKVEETGDIALSAVLCLKHDDPDEIAARVRELQEKRNSKQPVNFPSAGSTFKRPVGGFAAALIDQAGLKGYRVGGAMVSEKHAGFVINAGGATAEDVLSVMRHVRKTVYENSGIMLEPEVRLINCSL